MVVKELIVQLRLWPMDALVLVAESIDDPEEIDLDEQKTFEPDLVSKEGDCIIVFGTQVTGGF